MIVRTMEKNETEKEAKESWGLERRVALPNRTVREKSHPKREYSNKNSKKFRVPR